jgi:hypothetical protein
MDPWNVINMYVCMYARSLVETDRRFRGAYCCPDDRGSKLI